MEEKEIFWKGIKSTNNIYEASSCGKIRRVKGVVDFGNRKRSVGGKTLSPKTKKNGYLEVSLNYETNKGRSKYVHRLIVEAFIGDIPEGMCINHKDGVKSNNNISNLEIVTYSQNQVHAVKNGLRNDKGMKGSSHPFATIDESVVLKIREEYDNGVPSREIAKKYGMNLSTARKIMYRNTWKHI